MPRYVLWASLFWESAYHIGGTPYLADDYSLHISDKIFVPGQHPLFVGPVFAVFQSVEQLAPLLAHQWY